MNRSNVMNELGKILGPQGLLTAPEDIADFGIDWRRLQIGRPLAVARPANTAQVAELLRLCNTHGIGVVPQGGNTSMVAGATPSAAGDELVLCLARLNQVRQVDPRDLTITLEAGTTLRAAQEAASAAGCQLPLSIGSEGSAQIGGVLSTNAGGNNTLRYGNARDLVLGLEVVLADGSVIEALRRLRKDNTGYALRHLFVGAEGTLGVITAAVLRLVPAPRQSEVALCALASAGAALALLGRLQRHDPAALVAFEYISDAAMQLVLRHIPDTALPVAAAPAYALIHLATPRPGSDLRAGLEQVLAEAIEAEDCIDAVMAESLAQQAALWRLREEQSEAQKRAGASVKNDISVPVSSVPDFLARASAACAALIPNIVIAPFGHLGDGNIHFNLVQPPELEAAQFLGASETIMAAVNDVVRQLDGSFSAEHGIGRLKPAMLAAWRGGAELATMRAIKQALDPNGILNPGKLFPDRVERDG
jgi:FAD/FMN-containing dehydrogenase